MAHFQGVPINWRHVALVLAIVVLIVISSITLLPERFIDYGILVGFLVWTGYLLVSQWAVPPLRRFIYIAIAVALVGWTSFALWPFDSPM